MKKSQKKQKISKEEKLRRHMKNVNAEPCLMKCPAWNKNCERTAGVARRLGAVGLLKDDEALLKMAKPMYREQTLREQLTAY